MPSSFKDKIIPHVSQVNKIKNFSHPHYEFLWIDDVVYTFISSIFQVLHLVVP